MRAGGVLLGLVLAALAAPALAKCVVPKPVAAYLRTRPSWVLVADTHLSPADLRSWRREHRGACPGLAAVDLAGDGGKSYALAVLNRARGVRHERLILLRAAGKTLKPSTLVPAFAVGDPILVWRSRARAVREFGSKRRIALPHDSIRFEKPGMSSKVFYLEDGRIQTVLVAN